MNQERIRDLHGDYTQALQRLEEALNEETTKGDILVDAVIQRFEFSFELAWKLAKSILAYQGVEANTPRTVIKEAFRAALIQNGDGWIDMLEDRNKTAHIYDETEAKKIYHKIREHHFKLLKDFASSATQARRA